MKKDFCVLGGILFKTQVLPYSEKQPLTFPENVYSHLLLFSKPPFLKLNFFRFSVVVSFLKEDFIFSSTKTSFISNTQLKSCDVAFYNKRNLSKKIFFGCGFLLFVPIQSLLLFDPDSYQLPLICVKIFLFFFLSSIGFFVKSCMLMHFSGLVRTNLLSYFQNYPMV